MHPTPYHPTHSLSDQDEHWMKDEGNFVSTLPRPKKETLEAQGSQSNLGVP
jgi:hypothetical protein